MPIYTMSFKVSEEIARGLADGRYRIFGAVVRDNAGQVVKMLEPIGSVSRAAKNNAKVVIVAVVISAMAGGAIYAYTRFNRKARLARQLSKIDQTIQTAFAEHPSELTRDDLHTIRASIDDFLRATEEQTNNGITLSLSDDAKKTLITFAESLRSCSAELAAFSHSTEPVPELVIAPIPSELISILNAMRGQLEYQDRNWPAA